MMMVVTAVTVAAVALGLFVETKHGVFLSFVHEAKIYL